MSIVHPFSRQANLQSNLQATVPLTPLFTLAAGVACAEAINTLTGIEIGLKPINDLYVDGRKLGGILTESIISYEAVANGKSGGAPEAPLSSAKSQNPEPICRALITGIGINVLPHEEIEAGCRTDARHRPISLRDCLPGAVFNQLRPENILDELMEAVGAAVNKQYAGLFTGEFQTGLAQYRQYQIPGTELPDELNHWLTASKTRA
jgi:biotin-(acetyl-CoA carboxylase) ligase